MSEENERFTVEEYTSTWFRVWDNERGTVATTGHLTHELAQASADRLKALVTR